MDTVVNIQLNCTFSQCPKLSDFLGEDPLYVYDKPHNFLLICIYVPLILAALISNVLLILVVSQNSSRGSVTNYFLVNLAVSDLLVTILCMPMSVAQATYHPWIYGNLMCKLSTYLQGVAVSSGVFTITAMSLDQCWSIIQPMRQKLVSRKRVCKVIVFIWCLAMTVFGPLLFVRKIVRIRFVWDTEMIDSLYCVESWPDNLSQHSFGIFCFVAVYAIPGFIVLVAYTLLGLQLCSRNLLPEYELTRVSTVSRTGNETSANLVPCNSSWQVNSTGDKLVRERRRIAKILLVLAVTFALCWLPYSVLTLFLDLNSNANQKLKPDDEQVDDSLINISTSWIPFTLLLGHMNSVINPILYCMLSKNFCNSIFNFVGYWMKRLCTQQQSTSTNVTFHAAPNPIEPNVIFNNQVSSHDHDENIQDQRDDLPETSYPDVAEKTSTVYGQCSKNPYFHNSSIPSITADTCRPSTIACDASWNNGVAKAISRDRTVTSNSSLFNTEYFLVKKWNAPLSCNYQAKSLPTITEEPDSQASINFMSANSCRESSTNPEDWV